MTWLARLAPSAATEGRVATWALMVLGLVAAAGLAERLGLRRRAAARHGLWLCALALVIAGPGLVAGADRSGLGRWRIALGRAEVAAPRPAPEAPPRLDPPPLPLPAVAVEAPREAGPPTVADRSPPAGPDHPAGHEAPRPAAGAIVPAGAAWTRADGLGLAVLAWLAGVALGLIRLGRGIIALRRLRTRLRPLDPGMHAEALAEAGAAVGLERFPPVLTAPGLAEPFAAGLARPYVAVPGGLAGPALRDVLIHEAAHVARRDPWVGLLQRLTGVAFWPHPAVHHLNRRLNRAREEICDNFVLRLGDPRAYARTLLALTERRPAAGGVPTALGFAAAGWTLADRVAGLLDPERNRMTRPPVRSRLLAVALLLGVGLPLATLRFDRPAALAKPPTPDLPPPSPAAPLAPAEEPPVEPARLVAGIVVDVDGRPVAGAIVRPIRRNKAPEGATTGADGRFNLTLRGRFLLSEDLIAEADGGALLGLGKHEESRTAAPAGPVRITLKPSRPVTVRVRDAAGAPVPGAAVEAVDYGCTRQGTTGPDGAATLRIPEDGRARWVIAHKGGVGYDYFENYQATNARDLGPLPAEVTLTLDGTATVRVRAVDTQGRPVPGVEFTPWSIGKPGKLDQANIAGSLPIPATTGPDGVAIFDWLPARLGGVVEFLVRSADHSSIGSPTYEGKAPAEVTARLLRNTPIGGVVRRADGQVARDALIQAEGRSETNRYCRLYTRTDAAGRFAFKAYPDQTYMITMIDPAVAATSRSGVAVVEGRPQEGLDLRIVPGTLVQGRLTRGDDRAPAAGAGVTLIQKGEVAPGQAADAGGLPGGDLTLVRWFTTDERGRYTIRVGPGSYDVYAADSLGDRRALLINRPDAATLTHDFHLTRPARPVPFDGRVVERRADGDRPVPGAIVQVLPAGGYAGSKARADADGRFRCYRLAEGPLMVYARSPDGTRAGFATFAPKAGEGAAVVGPASRVSGRVVDPAGRPRADHRVLVRFHEDPNFEGSGRLAWYVRTDEQGRYTADGIAVGGRGEVSIRAEGPPPAPSRAQPFVIEDDRPVELPDLVIPSEPARPAGPAPR